MEQKFNGNLAQSYLEQMLANDDEASLFNATVCYFASKQVATGDNILANNLLERASLPEKFCFLLEELKGLFPCKSFLKVEVSINIAIDMYTLSNL
jgi:hypothetical protein